MANPFVLKLRNGAFLSDGDELLLEDLCQPIRQVGADVDVFSEGDEPRWLTVVLSGWACRYKMLQNGKRQITALFLPGDLCEPFGILPRFMDHAVSSLTPLTYALVHPQQCRAAAEASTAVEEALWWDALNAISIQNEQIVSVGRRQAIERMGHLFCELQVRLEMVGVADETGFTMPLTQGDLADILGLSSVHVNRSLQELRGAGLISLSGRRLRIHDRDRLEELSMFDVGYLHLEDKGRGWAIEAPGHQLTKA